MPFYPSLRTSPRDITSVKCWTVHLTDPICYLRGWHLYHRRYTNDSVDVQADMQPHVIHDAYYTLRYYHSKPFLSTENRHPGVISLSQTIFTGFARVLKWTLLRGHRVFCLTHDRARLCGHPELETERPADMG